MTPGRPSWPTLALAASLALVAGCGGTTDSPAAQGASSPTPPASAASSPGATSQPATGKALKVTITGKRVDPAPAQVEIAPGETLTLTVTSDHDDELHAHGFEVEKELKAGVPVTVQLRTDLPGVYEVETHQPALRLLSVAVR